MQLTRLQRAAAAALALTLSSALAACQPTGNPRCDALTAQRAITESIGYRVRCDADSPGVSVGGRSVLGWTDHRSRTIWLWPSKMADNRVLTKVAWHEIGHVVWDRRGHTGSQAEEERWADGFAYCAQPMTGVSYAARPADCSAYRV